MSPLWPNQVYASLTISQLALVYRTAFTKRVLEKRHITLNEPTIDWHAILQQLEIVLNNLKLPANTELHMILASDLVRYITLPAQDTQMNHVEKLAYAKAAYREVYGTVASEWRIQCNDAAPNRPIVAAAIDEQLFDVIRQVVDKFQLKLKAVQPYLMHVFNRVQQQVGKAETLVAVIESNRLLLINFEQGNCLQVRNLKLLSNWQETLNQQLSRELLVSDQAHHEVYLYAPTRNDTKIDLTQGWQLKKLHLHAQDSRPAYAMLGAAL